MSYEEMISDQVKANDAAKSKARDIANESDRLEIQRKTNDVAESFFTETHAALRRIVANNSNGMERLVIQIKQSDGTITKKKVLSFAVPSGCHDYDYCYHRERNGIVYLSADGTLYWVRSGDDTPGFPVYGAMTVYRKAVERYKFFGKDMFHVKHVFADAKDVARGLRRIYPEPEAEPKKPKGTKEHIRKPEHRNRRAHKTPNNGGRELVAAEPQVSQPVKLPLAIRLRARFDEETRKRVERLELAEQNAGRPIVPPERTRDEIEQERLFAELQREAEKKAREEERLRIEQEEKRAKQLRTRIYEVRSADDMAPLEALLDGSVVRVIGDGLRVPLHIVDDGEVFVRITGCNNTIVYDAAYDVANRVHYAPFQPAHTVDLLNL